MASSKAPKPVKASRQLTDTGKATMEHGGAGVKVEMQGPYWITRNRTNGVLEDIVEVWLTKPDLCRFEDGDVMWLPDLTLVDTEVTYFARWSLDKCRKECYVVPDTERECIKVGG